MFTVQLIQLKSANEDNFFYSENQMEVSSWNAEFLDLQPSDILTYFMIAQPTTGLIQTTCRYYVQISLSHFNLNPMGVSVCIYTAVHM